MSAALEAASPLLHRATVLPGWVDYNGHMNEAYYVVVFGDATDALLDRIGMDQPWRERTGCSLYTAEAHIGYLREARAGARLRVATQILGHDLKRLHVFNAMYREDDDARLATDELMLLFVDQRGPRVAPFPPDILARLKPLAAAHAGLPRPAEAGRAIALPPARNRPPV